MAGCFGNSFFDRNMERQLMNHLNEEADFDNWAEDVFANKINEQFYNENELWLDDYDGQCNKWINKLYSKSKSPEVAAAILERAFNIYIKKAG